MRLRSNAIRTAAVVVAIVALMIPGIGNLVLAQPIVPVETSGTNVCTGELSASYGGNPTSEANTLDLVWDGQTLTYPTEDLTGLKITYKVWSEGPPGDRNCKFSSSNSAFTNGAVQLLPANALRQVGTVGYTISNISAASRTIPLVPGNLAASVSTGTYDFRIDTTGVNNLAPVGVYTSTLTFTVTEAAP